MSWPLIKAFDVQKKRLYNEVLSDVSAWYLAEIKLRPLDAQFSNDKQTNALMNFITFDLHALVTNQGLVHMQELLQAVGTEQTVMIRLKDLVSQLYIKYGIKEIDHLRDRIYKTLDTMYGLSFRSKDIDTNNTLWLWIFFKHIYNSIPLSV